MLRKHQNIRIFDGNTDNLKFDINLVTDVTITSKRNEYTDTAVLRFPNRLADRSGAIDNILIGDKIEIRLGYFPNLNLEFTGFINFVGRDSPLIIECEDASFLLKRISLPKTSITNATIQGVISRFYDGPTEIVDAELGDLRITEGATVIKILDLFRTKYGILSFFQNGILKINTSLIEDNTARVFRLHEQQNVPVGGSDLKFQRNNEIPIISHGVTVRRDGTQLELYATFQDNVINSDIIVSDIRPPGALNTLKVPDLSREALTNLITRRLPLLYYTGVSGDVTTFGEPSIRHGDTVEYRDDRIPEKNGFYRVNAVTKEFTFSRGYKQKITLGLKTRA